MHSVQFNLDLVGRRIGWRSNNSLPLYQNPVGNITMLLRQRFQKVYRRPDGQLIMLRDYTIVPEHRFPLIQIPPDALASPLHCSLHLLRALHAFRLEDKLLNFLHQHVGRESIDLCCGGLTGFWMFAHVEVVLIEVVEGDEQFERLMKKEASRRLIEKLEMRQKKSLDGSKVKVGDQCAVCLEDLQDLEEEKEEEERKLTMMPCAHIFHRSCISRWLEEKISCPMCRREIQAVDFADCFLHTVSA
ncbi:RING/U-box superfamily protein [Melia azedarach]|uniref:RING/U-box superfamily protein n=1 Tax=Melia azedarach TaxID=155640 RepID=A0ACC1WQP0_MELAZ|nr:RING/U-box superfamily protein [Melia azedarach]